MQNNKHHCIIIQLFVHVCGGTVMLMSCELVKWVLLLHNCSTLLNHRVQKPQGSTVHSFFSIGLLTGRESSLKIDISLPNCLFQVLTGSRSKISASEKLYCSSYLNHTRVRLPQIYVCSISILPLVQSFFYLEPAPNTLMFYACSANAEVTCSMLKPLLVDVG